jgi:hypothetical protein
VSGQSVTLVAIIFVGLALWTIAFVSGRAAGRSRRLRGFRHMMVCQRSLQARIRQKFHY